MLYADLLSRTLLVVMGCIMREKNSTAWLNTFDIIKTQLNGWLEAKQMYD